MTQGWCLNNNVFLKYTLPETDIAPENRPSQKETSIPTIHFQVRAVSFSEGNRPLSTPRTHMISQEQIASFGFKEIKAKLYQTRRKVPLLINHSENMAETLTFPAGLKWFSPLIPFVWMIFCCCWCTVNDMLVLCISHTGRVKLWMVQLPKVS